MATKKTSKAADTPAPASKPKIYRATRGTGGDVIRDDEITEAEAIDERKNGNDIVVCGQDLMDNRDLAEKIETAAHGKCVSCPRHVYQGPGALPHFHPDPRSKAGGHCFYETVKHKSKKRKTGTKP